MPNKKIKQYLNQLYESINSIPPLKEVMLIPQGGKLNSEKRNNCKIGGKPDWVQNDETPKCKKCKTKMQFIGQIASIGCKEKKYEELVFGDCGSYYIFSCWDCGEDEKMIFQSS